MKRLLTFETKSKEGDVRMHLTVIDGNLPKLSNISLICVNNTYVYAYTPKYISTSTDEGSRIETDTFDLIKRWVAPHESNTTPLISDR